MNISSDQINKFRAELNKGEIQAAYRGLLDYILRLRTRFQKAYPEFEVPGNVYQGYMDMTYFSVIPPLLKQRRLKIAVVFVYDTFRFEVWLSGYNRQVQARYWQLIRESGWSQYHLVEDPLKADSILEHILVEYPDFDDPDELNRQIERGTQAFITEVESFLSSLEP